MRCKICDHVLEEKDGMQHHRLKYYDSLHQPQVQGAEILVEEPAMIHASTDLSSDQVLETPDIRTVNIDEKEELSESIEISSPNDGLPSVERMRLISEALKKYFGGDNWLEIRNSKQPGLGK